MKWHGKRLAVTVNSRESMYDRPMAAMNFESATTHKKPISQRSLRSGDLEIDTENIEEEPENAFETTTGSFDVNPKSPSPVAKVTVSPIHRKNKMNQTNNMVPNDSDMTKFVYKSPTGKHDEKFDYLDSDYMLDIKLDAVCDMMLESKHTVVYTGRGISSRAGGDKYGPSSLDEKRLNLKPTKAHHILSYLYHKERLVQHWIQPNHDRLAQKAGFPQVALTEVFGAWGDSRNPTIRDKDFGSPKAESANSLMRQEDKVEVCLCVGNSLSGIQSDSIAQVASDNHNGLIIINPKRTPRDHLAAVRIWGAPDDVLMKLTEKLVERKALKKSMLRTASHKSDSATNTFVNIQEPLAEDVNVQIPDPECEKKGEEWMRRFPTCNFHNFEIALATPKIK